MPDFASKILPVHFPSLTDNFGSFTEEGIAQECAIPGTPYRQIWSSADTIQIYFLDNNILFQPIVRIRDVNSDEIFNTVGLAVDFPNYYFAVFLGNLAGRTIVLEVGRNQGGGFALEHTSAEMDILSPGDPRLACSYEVRFWGCADDYGVVWLDDENTLTPTLPFTIRLTEPIRRSSELYTRTISEDSAKNYSVCGSEVDFIKVMKIELSPLWWIEKIGLIMSMRNVEIDGIRYIQEAPVQTGQQFRNYPLFKAEVLLRLAEQGNLYKLGCC